MDKEVSYNTNDTTHNDGSLSSTTNNSTTTNTNTKAKTNTDTNMDMDTDRAIPSFQLLTPDQELNKIYELFPVLEIPQPLPLPPASSSSAVASSSLRRKSTARSTSLKPSSPTEMSIGVRRTRASTRKLTQNRVAEVTGEIEEMVGGKGGVDPFEFPPATTSTSFHSASPSSSAGVSSSSSSSAPSSVVLAVDGQRRKRRRTSPGRDDITRIPATNTNTITTSSLSNTPSISNTQPTFSPSEITYLTSLLSPQTYLSRHRRHQYTEIRTRNIERETVRHYLHSVGSDAKAVLAQWDVGRERRELVDKIKREGGLKSVWWNNDDNKQSDDNDDERDDVRISQEKIKTPAFHKNKPRTTLHPTIPHPHHTDTNTTTTTHRRSARLTRTRTPFPFGVPFPPVLLSDPSAPQDFDDCVVRFL
ncbi:hypothetical protein BC832DRAFT_563592 [Gaertneriomyces semiglobifer]|nr:hypothetical protein BC832DRAFT_563592 [Gaertneriomyces semiglobifer]